MTTTDLQKTLIDLIQQFSNDLNASKIDDAKDTVIGVEDESTGALFFLTIQEA